MRGNRLFDSVPDSGLSDVCTRADSPLFPATTDDGLSSSRDLDSSNPCGLDKVTLGSIKFASSEL